MTENEMHDKIAKLLAKAEATNNAHEAEAFSAAAERLMLKWGIEEAEIRARATGERSREEIVVDRATHKGTYHQGHMRIAAAAAEGLGGIKVLQQKGYGANATVSIFIGYASDVARARALTASLLLQAETARRIWWKGYELRPLLATENERYLAQREFLFSFARAVEMRLRDMRREETSAAEDRTAGTEVALLNRDEQVQAAMNTAFPKLGTARGLRGSAHGRRAGAEAGGRANLGGTGIKGSGAALTN